MPVAATGWWETERAILVRRRIAALTQPGDVIIDVGCGRADMLDDPQLVDRIRINVDSHEWGEWQRRNGMLFVIANADALPFRPGIADLVGSFDVLEHIPDDARALREQVAVAGSTAHVVAAVPADPRLWSPHDDAVGHQRRYTFASFEALAERTGLAMRRRSHFYSFLWLPAWLTRRSTVRTREPAQGTGLLSRVARWIIGTLAAAERATMRRLPIPFGTSAWFEMSRAGEATGAPKQAQRLTAGPQPGPRELTGKTR